MAKTIALNLTINGVKQSITSINDLEKAIKGAEEELKGVEIGSTRFKQLTTEIRNAKNVAEDFQESLKGKDLEKRVGAFAKVGEAITASFAGAQAALSLFGNESEDVSKAAAKAQQVLTIALVARSAAEGLVQIKTVAATIATVAQTAATNAATVATRTFYSVLAANPIGAIIAAIGLLITAIVALTQEQEKQINVQEELASVTSQEAEKTKEQLRILTDLNGKRALQSKTLDELKKAYPGFNAFIDKENKLNADGVKFLELKIKAYQFEANVKALLQKISENNIKILQIESKSLSEYTGFWSTAWNVIKNGGNISAAAIDDFNDAVAAQKEEINKVKKETALYTSALDKNYDSLNLVYTELNDLEKKLEETNKTEQDNKRRTEEATKAQLEQAEAYKKGRQSIIQFNDVLEKLNKNQEDLKSLIDELNKVEVDPKILDNLKQIIDFRKQFVDELGKLTFDFRDTFAKLDEAIPVDSFLSKFATLRSQFENTFNLANLSVDERISEVQEAYDKFIKANGAELDQLQKDLILAIKRGYESIFKLIGETPGFEEFTNKLKDVDVAFDENTQNARQLYDEYAALQQLIGDLAFSFNGYKLEIEDVLDAQGNIISQTVKDLNVDPEAVRKSAENFLANLKKELYTPIAKQFLEEKKKIKLNELLNVKLTPVQKKEIQGEIDNINFQLEQVGKGITLDPTNVNIKQIEERLNSVVKQFQDLVFATVDAEQGILKVNKQVGILQTEINKITPQAIAGAIIQNVDEITKSITGLRTREEQRNRDFIQKIKNDEIGFQNFIKQLRAQNVISEKTTDEEILANKEAFLEAYIAFKLKEKEVNKEVAEENSKLQQDNYNEILRSFAQFSEIVQGFSQVNQQRIQADLEALQVAQQQALEGVVGNSEEAAKKRLEIEKEYEQKKKEIEKQGRLTSLRFSLVQTIANGAQAVVKALAEGGPILGPILAAINAGLSLAQVAIINDQIATTQSLRRGGRIRRMGDGGMLFGPSHEQGGIPLAYGGVIAEGNESVINRQSTLDYRDLLSSINMANGGRPMVVNTFDDSRIVEVLAKQNQQPIRAYVLESEITNNQAISKRLDDLSKF